MRDRYKNDNYFDTIIDNAKYSLNNYLKALEENNVNEERKPHVHLSIYRLYKQIIYANYAKGNSIESLKIYFQEAIKWMTSAWLKLHMKAFKGSKIYNHYFEGYYDEMLTMMSFGVLLNQPKEIFYSLATIIDRDEVKDLLFEFILNTQLCNRETFTETYTDIQVIPNYFKNLRLSINEKDKNKASKLIETYMAKDWVSRCNKLSKGTAFKLHENSGIYLGYLNMESAAISLLLNIDISSFENSEYFPIDLYNYAISK